MSGKDKLITKDEAFALAITLFKETQSKLKTCMQIIEVQGECVEFYGDYDCDEYYLLSGRGKRARACIEQVNGIQGKT